MEADIEQRLSNVESRRITQDRIINGAIKQRHVEEVKWIVPTLLNSWVNFDTTTHNQVQYTKDISGFVHLMGLVKSGSSASAVVFVLDAGFRPQFRSVFSVVTSPDVFCRFNVDANGNVFFTGASTTYACMDGVIFKAFQ